jgi:hypothetical protein
MMGLNAVTAYGLLRRLLAFASPRNFRGLAGCSKTPVLYQGTTLVVP